MFYKTIITFTMSLLYGNKHQYFKAPAACVARVTLG